MKKIPDFQRRKFIQTTAQASILSSSFLLFPQSGQTQTPPPNNSVNFVGPKEGYTPQIGTLVSMMNWMRQTIL